MFNVVRFVSAFIVATFLIACGSASTEVIDQDSIKAEKLLQNAQIAYKNSDCDKAMMYVDSIDSIYSKQVSVRRKSMPLKAQIKEQLIIKEIQKQDSLLVASEINKISEDTIYKIQLNKEKLERQLQVARNQIVRMQE